MNERRTNIALERIDRNKEVVFRVESRRWMTTRITELRAGAWGLEADGDLGSYRRGTLRLPWERLTELHYAPPGKGAIGGLYAQQGEWCSQCVLPRVSETQAEKVIAAIAECYPRVGTSIESALETAVGEAMAQKTLMRRGWLPSLGHCVVIMAAPLGRL